MDNSPLSRLPAELRNYIYELVLKEYRVKVYLKVCHMETRIWQPPALLRCSQQIRAEASPIYYTGNTFVITNQYRCSGTRAEDTLASWLRALNAPSRSLIRKIHLDDALYHKEDVSPRIAECKRRLEKAGLEIANAQIFVARVDRVLADRRNQWVTA